MVCQPCRTAAEQARRILEQGGFAPMGSLSVVMRRHCEGGTWCDCQHQHPHVPEYAAAS